MILHYLVLRDQDICAQRSKILFAPVSVLLVLRGGVACAPWLAAAAWHNSPVVVGKRSGGRLGGAVGEEGGLWLRTQGATD